MAEFGPQGSVEGDLDDELRAAFDLLVEEKLHAGITRQEARRAAAIELGQTEAIKIACVM